MGVGGSESSSRRELSGPTSSSRLRTRPSGRETIVTRVFISEVDMGGGGSKEEKKKEMPGKRKSLRARGGKAHPSSWAEGKNVLGEKAFCRRW